MCRLQGGWSGDSWWDWEAWQAPDARAEFVEAVTADPEWRADLEDTAEQRDRGTPVDYWDGTL